MSLEAYFPDSLSNRIKVKEVNFSSLLIKTRQELARLDGMLRHNALKDIVKAFLRAEEALASASLEMSEFSFEEYAAKLLDRGYEADDLNEIRFLLNYYPEKNREIQERGFSINSLNEFQQALLENRRKRKISSDKLRRRRQCWLYDAIRKKDEHDMRLYAYPCDETKNSLMENLDKFIRNSRKDPLITTAIAYGQLAMIHPWAYANGRTTGALIPYLLNFLGLTKERSFFLSSAFSKEKQEYFNQLVKLFQNGEWDVWVEYFLQKFYDQVISGQKKVDYIMEYTRRIKAEGLKKVFSKNTIFYLDLMLQFPIFTVREVDRKYNLRRSVLLPYVYEMLDTGILLKDNRQRHINYIFNEVFEIMEL